MYKYTEEELYNNYEFKIIKRALIREFPWVKDVYTKPEDLMNYNSIFLSVVIDPIELGEQMDWTPNPWVIKSHEQDLEYHSPYISLFFINLHESETDDLNEKLKDLIDNVRNSPALPRELKLKGGSSRLITIAEYIMNPGKPPYF
jgi:hypothetical protein